ncbi:MAG: GDP-mannose 4,6-dehydratase, partial [Pyrinomonadaceae bacterium]|nr:GDP-mannose 4,6-dehydratase [Pyrinomonadaceae bacterium]
LVAKCLKAVDSQAEIVSSSDRQRPERSEVGLLLCDAAKARRLLGWEPKICLDEGLRRTAEYLRTHLTQYRTKDYLI